MGFGRLWVGAGVGLGGLGWVVYLGGCGEVVERVSGWADWPAGLLPLDSLGWCCAGWRCAGCLCWRRSCLPAMR